MRFERREQIPPALAVLTPLIAVAISLTLAGGLIALAGAPVLTAFGKIITGAFGSKLAVTETLARTAPLILTGLAAAVAFRARLWNIGAEGQLYLGAIAVAAASAYLFGGLPGVVQIPLLFITGALAGMILLLIPLWLRLRFQVDEVVTTLLLNFVAVLFVSMLIDTVLKDPLAFGWPQSVPVAPEAELPRIIPRSRLHIGLLVAVVLAFIVHFLQSRTAFGLQSRAAGLNPSGAAFAGVPLGRTLVLVAMLSGGLAGLAGAVEVMGITSYVTTELSPGYGYSGIVVAMLAGLHPLGVVLAALFTAVMFVGADAMSRSLAVPSYIADVTVALSLLTMLVAIFFTQYRIRR
ncbi:ABC transporter permease [Rhodobacter sp. 24-YEA-8]|uniref:ABC transporter permease n=1 Tax=Rhodobacter sp. 24-YEA-8 TaxID=1884310 RepID=UPI00089A5013|nr:ABC transporter permease [Rhodobacter sp. 24-YEA-8]SED20285.1 nucleoside ABC transporter membrane protein [Rhodobacter sp. 24-YEA-8]